MTRSQVVPMAAAQIGEVARAIARAFQDEPIPVWTMPDPEVRRAKLPITMELGVRCGHHFGEVFTTAGEPCGGAVWFPPGRWQMLPEQMQQAGLGLDDMAAVVGKDAAERLVIYEEHEARLHKQHMPEPHWYLALLGVAPEHQGRGIGRALLAPILARADVEGLACYLETERQRNVDFYATLGFEVVVHGVEPHGRVEFWTMKRPPVA